jgi:16S rRNA processing protein RimM
MEKDRLVPLGRIVRTHGVRGGVKIYPYGETLAEMQPGEILLIASTKRSLELTLRSLQPMGKYLVVQFEESSDISTAESLLREEVAVPEDRLPETSEGEYYHFQLIGLRVETLDGKNVGLLESIMETGGNDVYVIRKDDKEFLIPAVEGVIHEVMLDRGIMLIDPPEGLIDDL